MKGKFGLTYSEIDSVVSAMPGAYILVNNNNNAIYVGRADSDLNNRLKDHLPQNETNSCIKRSGVVAFYFENTAYAKDAYILECNWYHKYTPTCNMAHPAKVFSTWLCPICGL
jgi:excinuclease UvrABC nuclease subunit